MLDLQMFCQKIADFSKFGSKNAVFRADLGGGGRPSSYGFDPLPTQKVHFVLF